VYKKQNRREPKTLNIHC